MTRSGNVGLKVVLLISSHLVAGWLHSCIKALQPLETQGCILHFVISGLCL